jgi:hypothetical protein
VFTAVVSASEVISVAEFTSEAGFDETDEAQADKLTHNVIANRNADSFLNLLIVKPPLDMVSVCFL